MLSLNPGPMRIGERWEEDVSLFRSHQPFFVPSLPVRRRVVRHFTFLSLPPIVLHSKYARSEIFVMLLAFRYPSQTPVRPKFLHIQLFFVSSLDLILLILQGRGMWSGVRLTSLPM